MDFRFPPEDEAFRSGVREFVQREWRNGRKTWISTVSIQKNLIAQRGLGLPR